MKIGNEYYRIIYRTNKSMSTNATSLKADDVSSIQFQNCVLREIWKLKWFHIPFQCIFYCLSQAITMPFNVSLQSGHCAVCYWQCVRIARPKCTSNIRFNNFNLGFFYCVAHHRQCDWNELLSEFEILKHVNITGHRNIIKLIGACSNTGMWPIYQHWEINTMSLTVKCINCQTQGMHEKRSSIE